MKKKPHIYLSSTYDDLKEYRRAVYNALRKSDYEVIGMEDYVATDDRVINVCLKDIDECVDIYVGIFAFRYGHIPSREHIRECRYTAQHDDWQELSITEIEYRYAADVASLPCLTFVAKHGIKWDLRYVDAITERDKEKNPGSRIDKLRNHLLCGKRMVGQFSSPNGLAVDVLAAVKKQLQESGDMLAEKAERKLKITWDTDEDKDGSPYPGLEHFTRQYVRVFFGRELEVDEILDRLYTQNNRFILISGDSGVGKSSCVDAGLLPRLEENGLPGGQDCLCLHMVPSHGHHPWDALMRAFREQARQAGVNECAIGEELVAKPKVLSMRIEKIISKCGTRAKPVLFLDQMEQLFTRHAGEHAADFITELYAAVQKKVLWVLATIRNDHLQHCYHCEELLQVLRGPGHYPLGQVHPSTIGDIIKKPAQVAGLEISDRLARRIARDSGSESGSLPLLAFVLQRLFDKRDGQALSEDVYDKIGGVQGALGKYAEDIFGIIDRKAQEALPRVFRELVKVDDQGVVTRQQAHYKRLTESISVKELVKALINARLLVSGQGIDGEPIVELAHDALIEGWPDLASWTAGERIQSFLSQFEAPPSKGSPFPGLRPFTVEDASIFFGRDKEIRELLIKLTKPSSRFIAIIGEPGSGKSSLVSAGLLPRLLANALPGSKDWAWISMNAAGVSGNPFRTLADKLTPLLKIDRSGADDIEIGLRTNANLLIELAAGVLENRPIWAGFYLFIDQFEELFTLVDPADCDKFIQMLAKTAQARGIHILVTMRADFVEHCKSWPALAKMLKTGSFLLAAPSSDALLEMITRPAEIAGVQFEDGLEQLILDDTGTEPGALALMAFALNELWKTLNEENRLLTFKAYESFLGVSGAIGKRAEDAINSLEVKGTLLETTLGHIFRELVVIGESRAPTRRKALLSKVADDRVTKAEVNALTDARLLVVSRGEEREPMVELAHEAIFTSWPRIRTWIKATGDDLRLRRKVSRAAAEWDTRGHDNKYLWSDDQMVDVVGMLERLGLGLDELSDSERRFLGLIDRETMLAELEDPDTSHERRAAIGVCLSLLGDPRTGVGLRADKLPGIAWCEVPGGEITLEIERSGRLSRFLKSFISKIFRVDPFDIAEHPMFKKRKIFRVDPFDIAKYPVTWIQYRSFLEAADGFKDTRWWQGLLSRVEEEHRQFIQRDNHPVENLCWLEAIAFCRWLTAKLGYEIRLPTEWEWRQAATGGNPDNEYPWVAMRDSSYANTDKSGLNRSTAVGMYPHGVSPVGAFDMIGNVWELCLNEYNNIGRVGVSREVLRSMCGRSWYYSRLYAPSALRRDIHPHHRFNYVGFRLVRVP